MQQDNTVFNQLSPNDAEVILKAIPPEVKGYLVQILTDGGLRDVEDDIMEEMVVQLYVKFNQFLVGEITESLPEEKLEEFAHIAESDPTQEIVKDYLQKNLTNAQDVFTHAFAKFRDLYLEGVTTSQTPTSNGL